MKLTFQLADPAGNLTLLVRTPVPREQYQDLAGRLLAIRELKAQQVGFLVPPQGPGCIRLEMMGGEFCGNALRSAGLFYAADQGIRRARKFPVEISGCDEPLTVQVNPLTSQVTAEMPIPREIVKHPLFGTPARVVRLPGIVHAVSQKREEVGEEEVRETLKELAAAFDSPAAGVMFWQSRAGTMRPAVYVRDTDSLYFESSCASGSTAVAACHALGAGRDGVHKLDLRQPGGTIQTTAAVRSGHLESITIGGTVTLGPVYEVEF